MEPYVWRDQKKLRRGYTTGSCAAAAAKAAAWMLLFGERRDSVALTTPAGTALELPVENISCLENRVSCGVRKDAGDDPDVTNGTLIMAEVSRMPSDEIEVEGGAGVGRVTLPGLDQPVGAAAINRVPRRMILEAVRSVCELAGDTGGLRVEISVPGGEEIARKTYNPHLGIVGGISILGTSGVVEPMSEAALVETIRVEMCQRAEMGMECLILTPGNYGADFLRDTWGFTERQVVKCSNFVGEALDFSVQDGIRGLLLVGHAGKLVKLAGGVMNTHSRYADCRMEILTAHAALAGARRPLLRQMMDCVTVDQALALLPEDLMKPVMDSVIEKIRGHLERRTNGKVACGAVMFTNRLGLLAQTENAERLMKEIKGFAENFEERL